MSTLSIVVPTVGRSDSLRRLLASIDAQEVPPLETIVVDQNPPGFLDLDRSIDHVRMSVANVAAARNLGFARSRGTHVLFVDDDEVLPAGFIARVLTTCERHPEVRCLWPMVHAMGREAQALRHWKRRAAGPKIDGTSLFEVMRVGSGGVVFERAYFRLSGGYDEVLFRIARGSEDWELSSRMRRRRLPMWADASLFVLHAAAAAGGCAVRSRPYEEVRADTVRATLFRARIASGPPFRLRLRDAFPLIRFAFLSSLGRADGRPNVLRRPWWHLRLLWREIRASRALVEEHAARYADPMYIDHLANVECDASRHADRVEPEETHVEMQLLAAFERDLE